MQTLIEKLYEQKVGEDRRYRTLWPDEIRIPAIFPGRGIDLPMELPGPKMPTEIPLEVRLGYQAPQSLYAMYSFGVNDKPVTIGNWFEPLAGATLGPYPTPNYKKTGMEFDGGITFYPRPNTGIFVEDIGYGYKNLYSFHDKGPGRMDGPF